MKERSIEKDESLPTYLLYTQYIFLQNKLVNSFNQMLFGLPRDRKLLIKAKDYMIGDVDKEKKKKYEKVFQKLLLNSWDYPQICNYEEK